VLRVVQVLMLSLQHDLPAVGGQAVPLEPNLQLHLGLSSL
jgi:hypothetical protein